MKKLLLLCCAWALWCANHLSGQGFQHFYDLNITTAFERKILAVAPTPDGGFVFYGSFNQASTVLGKTDPDGALIWLKPFSVSFSDDPVADLFVLPNGHYALGVYIETMQAMSTILEFDAAGNLLQQRSFPGLTRMSPTADGGYYVVIRLNETSMQLYRLDAAMVTIWEKPVTTPSLLFMPDMITAADGGVCVLGSYDASPGNYNNPKLIKVDANGDKQWEQGYDSTSVTYFGALSQTPSGDFVFNITDGVTGTVIRTDPEGNMRWKTNLGDAVFSNCVTADDGLALTGTSFPGYNIHLAKLNANGQVHFTRNYAPNGYGGEGYCIRATTDDGLIIGGTAFAPGAGNSLGLLIKTDGSGNVYSNFIRGTATFDQNHNCTPDPGEWSLANWIVTDSSAGFPLTTRTDANGFYEFNVPPGSHTVTLHPPGPIWEACDGGQYQVTVNGPTDTVTQHFAVQDSALCSLLDVSIATLFLRRCFNASYHVTWCNRGTVAANNAVVQIILPPELDYVAATLPPSAQSGDTLWFDIGTVGFGECGSLQLGVNVDCNSTVLGQTLCVKARIYPDTLCVTPLGYSGAKVIAGVHCLGDTIVDFTLKNIGSAPTGMLDYIITEDYVVLYNGQFDLVPGQDMHIMRPANGSTQRIASDQVPNYPFPSMPSAAIEGCGGLNSAGVINHYTLDDADPFTDIDCQEVRGSYDPNDKQGLPIGYGSEQWVEPGTELTYLIRFQNTGTDTAFFVEVRDTLSPWLDPATLRVGAASHDFDWLLRGSGALSFQFNNILLPDSNANEAASHGYIQFTVRPKAEAPLGTIIPNTAAIYFDFNAPVVTNTTTHRLGRDFYVVTQTGEPGWNGLAVRVQPNPFSDQAQLSLPAEITGTHRFLLFDASGRTVYDQTFTGPTLDFRAAEWTSGYFWFEIQAENGTVLARGKMVKK